MITLGSILGTNYEEDFAEFDLTEIQGVLATLANTASIDLAHAELLQQQALRGADLASEFLGKLVKTTSYLEGRVNATKNKASLEYAPAFGKSTADLRKQAGEASPEVEELSNRLAKAKGARVMLEKKLDILIKTHHHYKEIAMGMRKGIVSHTQNTPVEGYE
jgi:hypothetical protein